MLHRVIFISKLNICLPESYTVSPGPSEGSLSKNQFGPAKVLCKQSKSGNIGIPEDLLVCTSLTEYRNDAKWYSLEPKPAGLLSITQTLW